MSLTPLCRIGYAHPFPEQLSDDCPRIVTAKPPPKPRATIQTKFPDIRRNLYVLGLPFDLSKWVAYIVIRATLQ